MKCPHCNSQITGNTKFCPECGKKIAADSKNKPVSKKKEIDESDEFDEVQEKETKPGKFKLTSVFEEDDSQKDNKKNRHEEVKPDKSAPKKKNRHEEEYDDEEEPDEIDGFSDDDLEEQEYDEDDEDDDEDYEDDEDGDDEDDGEDEDDDEDDEDYDDSDDEEDEDDDSDEDDYEEDDEDEDGDDEDYDEDDYEEDEDEEPAPRRKVNKKENRRSKSKSRDEDEDDDEDDGYFEEPDENEDDGEFEDSDDSEDDEEDYEDEEEIEYEDDGEDEDDEEDDEDEDYDERPSKKTSSKKHYKPASLENLDELTGLLNKRAYTNDLKRAKQKDLAVIYIDINNLKTTNDTLGHNYGNKLILAVAKELNKLFPQSAYRVGGDEFIVILQGEGPNVIEKKLQLFKEEMYRQTERDENGLIYQAAVGYAVGDGELTKQEIEEQAESLMYENKKELKAANPSMERGGSTGGYDPNFDHYYDDVMPEMLDEINRFPIETIFKIIGALAMIAGAIIYCIYYVDIW